MSVQICTAHRYSVGMFGYDVCMEYVTCGVAAIGETFAKVMCEFLSKLYTSTIYDGTDPPTYYVAGKPRDGTASRRNFCIIHIFGASNYYYCIGFTAFCKAYMSDEQMRLIQTATFNRIGTYVKTISCICLMQFTVNLELIIKNIILAVI